MGTRLQIATDACAEDPIAAIDEGCPTEGGDNISVYVNVKLDADGSILSISLAVATKDAVLSSVIMCE